jgi:putative PIN family toxin of toxin-antitoxin system
MKCCAVVDTNVLVSALLSKKSDTATVRVFRAMLQGQFTPLYHQEILDEYDEVFHRPRFHLTEDVIQTVMAAIKKFGIEVFPQPTGEILIDLDDLIFYEVAMEKRDDNAYLVTGNRKHYPVKDFIVTPSEMMDILDNGQ